MMTFHESYGYLPMRLLRTYKSANVSPADHDGILTAFGQRWQDAETIPAHTWDQITEFVGLNTRDGNYRSPRYM